MWLYVVWVHFLALVISVKYGYRVDVGARLHMGLRFGIQVDRASALQIAHGQRAPATRYRRAAASRRALFCSFYCFMPFFS